MEKKNDIFLLAIVAIVAIVGIIVMIMASGPSGMNGTDNAGQATRALTTVEDASTQGTKAVAKTEAITAAEPVALSKCTDSDVNLTYPDGINPFTKGIATLGELTKKDFCRNYNSTTLVEYYCGKGKILSKDINCVKYNMICEEGLCKEQALPVCGDGIKNGYEECDGNDWGNITDCTDFGYTGGILTCNNACQFDTTQCTVGPICGNNMTEPGEECEIGQIASCSNFGNYTNGTATCNYDCTWNMNQCVYTPTCSDTDGGLNLFLAGTVYGYNGNAYVYHDSCISSTQLREYWCASNLPTNHSFNCTCVNATCVNQTGTVYVSTIPSGAYVSIDNIYRGVSPITVSGLSLNTHTYNITKPGYNVAMGNFVIAFGQPTYLNVTLTPLNQSTNIAATGGTLYYYEGNGLINNNPYAGDRVIPKVTVFNSGTTPINLQAFSVRVVHTNTGQNQVNWCQPTTTWLQPGQYGQCTTYDYGSYTLVAGTNTFSFAVDYYNQLVESNENDNSYTYNRYAIPNGTGNLYVVSVPSGANIYVDNVFKNVTPRTITGLSVGSHTVKLTKQGYYDYVTTKTIYGGNTTNLSVTLTLNQTNSTSRPDLFAEDILLISYSNNATLNNNMTPYTSFTIKPRVKNLGNASINATQFYNRITFANTTNTTSTYIKCSNVNYMITPGMSFTCNSDNIIRYLGPGTYPISIGIDYYNTVVETNEGNIARTEVIYVNY